MSAAPVASRPLMPGYDVSPEGDGMLPWSWAEDKLANAHNYWFATTRADGRPHVMAVWGLWIDGAFFFSTGAKSRKARNLAGNPNCVVCTESAEEAVIVEGVAQEVHGADIPAEFVRAYKAKYDWEMDTAGGGIYAVRPTVAFAFTEAADRFGSTATRWRFAVGG